MKRSAKCNKLFKPSPIPDRSDMNCELNEEWNHLNELIWKTVGCVAEQPPPVSEDINNNRSEQCNNPDASNGASTSSIPSVVDLSYIWRDNGAQTPDGSFSPLPALTQEGLTPDSRRVYVSNIPFKYTSADLQRLCAHVGTVSNAEVIYNDRGSKGFGFVSFESEISAKMAIQSLNGLVIDGRKIEVHPATPKEKTASRKKKVEEETELQMLLLQKIQSLKFTDK